MKSTKARGETVASVSGELADHGAHAATNVVTFPFTVADAPADENVASVVAVLQEQLAMAREGKLRSVAVVSVTTDGGAIGTQWSCTHGDVSSLIGKLAVLSHDMMAARR